MGINNKNITPDTLSTHKGKHYNILFQRELITNLEESVVSTYLCFYLKSYLNKDKSNKRKVKVKNKLQGYNKTGTIYCKQT